MVINVRVLTWWPSEGLAQRRCIWQLPREMYDWQRGHIGCARTIQKVSARRPWSMRPNMYCMFQVWPGGDTETFHDFNCQTAPARHHCLLVSTRTNFPRHSDKTYTYKIVPVCVFQPVGYTNSPTQYLLFCNRWDSKSPVIRNNWGAIRWRRHCLNCGVIEKPSFCWGHLKPGLSVYLATRFTVFSTIHLGPNTIYRSQVDGEDSYTFNVLQEHTLISWW